MIEQAVVRIGEQKLAEFMGNRDQMTIDIDWNDYNYPPKLFLIHFDPDDIPSRQLAFHGRLLHYQFLLLCCFFV